MGKDKGRTKKQKPFSYRVRQGKDKGKTVKNKTLLSKRNKSHIHIGKDKGRTEKHYPYSYRERQGKNRKTLPIFTKGKTREE